MGHKSIQWLIEQLMTNKERVGSDKLVFAGKEYGHKKITAMVKKKKTSADVCQSVKKWYVICLLIK